MILLISCYSYKDMFRLLINHLMVYLCVVFLLAFLSASLSKSISFYFSEAKKSRSNIHGFYRLWDRPYIPKSYLKVFQKKRKERGDEIKEMEAIFTLNFSHQHLIPIQEPRTEFRWKVTQTHFWAYNFEPLTFVLHWKKIDWKKPGKKKLESNYKSKVMELA